MRCAFLLIAGAALAACAQTAKDTLLMQMSAASGTYCVMAVYSSQSDDPAMRRALLISVDTILQGKNFPVTSDVEREIGNDLRSGHPLLVMQAIETSGHLKLRNLTNDLKRCFFEADRIDAGRGSGIRQAVIAALESMNGADLSSVFLEFMLDRKSYWFNGDLLMVLQALARHGDALCLPHVRQLKDRVLGFMSEPEAAPGDQYRRAKCGELIAAITVIESNFSKG